MYIKITIWIFQKLLVLHDQLRGDVVHVVHGNHGDELKLIFLKSNHFWTVVFKFHPKYIVILAMVPDTQLAGFPFLNS